MNIRERRRWAHHVVAEAAALLLRHDTELLGRLGVDVDDQDEVRAETLELVTRLRARAEGDSKVCPHPAVGRWVWPPEGPRDDAPYMSVYVCTRRACRRRADAAVRRVTGHGGEFVQFVTPAEEVGS